MKFEENQSVRLPKIQDCLIYFLVKKNEVVYVGQTKNNINRPLQHKNDKDFDDIYVLPCNEIELDYLEDKYIKKYNPFYNKIINLKVNSSLTKIRNHINSIFPTFNLSTLKKIIINNNIPTITFKGTVYVENKYEKNILYYYKEGVKNGTYK